MSIWTLRAFGPARSHVHTGLRDRAMLLLSTTVAFRGNSSRLLLFSDLFFRSIAMGNIGEGVKLQVCLNLSMKLFDVKFKHRHWEFWPISQKQMSLVVLMSMGYFAIACLSFADLGDLDFICSAISTFSENAFHLRLTSTTLSILNLADVTGINIFCFLVKATNLTV